MIEQPLETPPIEPVQPVQTVQVVQNSPEQIATQQVKELNSRVRLLSLFLIGTIVVIVGLFLKEERTSLLTSESPQPSEQTTENQPSKSSFTPFVEDPARRIVFTRHIGNPEDTVPTTAWVMNSDGTNLQNLNLDGVNPIWKQPKSSKIFYISPTKYDELIIKDVQTDQLTSFSPIKHPESDVQTTLTISSQNQISPNDSGIVFHASFSKPCPTPTQEQQDNIPSDGPGCSPDPNPDLPTGYYYFDFQTQQKTYIGEEFAISGWDTENNLIYYTTAPSFPITYFRSFNTVTGENKEIESSNIFGYWVYKLFKTGQFVRVLGETGNSGGVGYSSITLSDPASDVKKEIDKGGWADIQPFLAFAPDESVFLYEKRDSKTPQLSSGIPRYNLIGYDFATGQKKQLTTDNPAESYRASGVWIDNDTFITAVNTLEEKYFNNNNFLVSINVKTGEIKRITVESDVDDFASF